MWSTLYFHPQVAIYQITDTGLCNQILKLYKGGVNISIIVSARIVSYTDWKEAQDCYGLLYNNGMKGRIRKALTKFSFAHQKYWIIDEKSVHLSTGNSYINFFHGLVVVNTGVFRLVDKNFMGKLTHARQGSS